jgi:hypothetical protein
MNTAEKRNKEVKGKKANQCKDASGRCSKWLIRLQQWAGQDEDGGRGASPLVSPCVATFEGSLYFRGQFTKKRDMIESMLLWPESSSLLGLLPSHHCSQWTKRAHRGRSKREGRRILVGIFTLKRLIASCSSSFTVPVQHANLCWCLRPVAVTMFQEEFSTYDTLCQPDILKWICVAHEFGTTHVSYFTTFFWLRTQPASLCNLKVYQTLFPTFVTKSTMQYSIQ